MLLGVDDDDCQAQIAARHHARAPSRATRRLRFRTTRDWFGAFNKHRTEHDGGAGPLPQRLFEHGESTYAELLQSSAAPVLLHGDLHHYNILSAERAPWLAIDPHGLVGEPAFEVGAYFGNPVDVLAQSHPNGSWTGESEIFAERLGLDRKRVVAWGFAYQMLSAVWSAENGGTGWHRAVGVAELLSSML